MNKELVNKIINVGKNFYDRGWLFSTSGNISLRTDEGIIITAAGTHKGYLSESDFVLIDYSGRVLEGTGKPSGETDFHLQIYKNSEEINSVIHTHSVYSSLVSMWDKLNFIDNEIMKAFDGVKDPSKPISIPMFPNIQQKEQVLSMIDDYFNSSMEKVYGYLLKGHGLFAFASSLEKAQIYVETFEFLFKYEYLKSR